MGGALALGIALWRMSYLQGSRFNDATLMRPKGLLSDFDPTLFDSDNCVRRLPLDSMILCDELGRMPSGTEGEQVLYYVDAVSCNDNVKITPHGQTAWFTVLHCTVHRTVMIACYQKRFLQFDLIGFPVSIIHRQPLSRDEKMDTTTERSEDEEEELNINNITTSHADESDSIENSKLTSFVGAPGFKLLS
ncbi:hypothetical protein WN51_14277 [Melipona quadrifasciata]|uniref:Uncharacterized protein n=1 Tax=Melipona quadrifasciata TaxID=166423 RepID=A0A0M9A138_9HYME|nr:hypothetical protein WN51_14277 [Melipona quadrifasciata]